LLATFAATTERAGEPSRSLQFLHSDGSSLSPLLQSHLPRGRDGCRPPMASRFFFYARLQRRTEIVTVFSFSPPKKVPLHWFRFRVCPPEWVEALSLPLSSADRLLKKHLFLLMVQLLVYLRLLDVPCQSTARVCSFPPSLHVFAPGSLLSPRATDTDFS